MLKQVLVGLWGQPVISDLNTTVSIRYNDIRTSFYLGQYVLKCLERPFCIDTSNKIFKLEKGDNNKVDAGYFWCSFDRVEYMGTEVVYDIAVEDDCCFTANTLLVHNCQDISNAGKQRGFDKGSKTRSGLLWECERVIEQVRPTYLLLENVEPLGSSLKFRAGLNEWLGILEDYGYENYCFFCNARDYGIPQNRARFFVVSTLDKSILFEPPMKLALDKTVKDLLEDFVDSRYYVSVDTILRFVSKPEIETTSFF